MTEPPPRDIPARDIPARSSPARNSKGAQVHYWRTQDNRSGRSNTRNNWRKQNTRNTRNTRNTTRNNGTRRTRRNNASALNNVTMKKKKQFEKKLSEIQKEYYIEQDYNTKGKTYQENVAKWIGKDNTNTYNVGESFYTRSPPTIDTPNYDDDYTFKINKKDVVVQESLIKNTPYEKFLISAMSEFMPENGIMLDIGTNIGTVAIPMSRANKNVTVYAFEPLRQNYVLMLENIRLNNAYNILPYPVAVGHEIAEIAMSNTVDVAPQQLKTGDKGGRVPLNSNATELHLAAGQIGEGGEKVKMLSIDSLNIERIDVMKIDIEGAEPLAFYGAKESIKKHMPIIAFEHNRGSMPQEMIDSLQLNDRPDITNFSIVRYCKTLGYKKMWLIPYDNFMLIPPDKKSILINLKSILTSLNKSVYFDRFKINPEDSREQPEELEGFILYKYDVPKWHNKDSKSGTDPTTGTIGRPITQHTR